MSSVYIVTFFSHFGAVRFKKFCDGQGWSAKIMPVPRTLSSSCGVCVQYEGIQPNSHLLEDVEQIVRVTERGYLPVYRAENS